jgi:hypothetical protein
VNNKTIDHPVFKPGDSVERIVPIKLHPNSKYDLNRGTVVSVYTAPISGLLISVQHGTRKQNAKYSLSHWRKINK